MSKNKSFKQRMILFGLITLFLISAIINVKPEENQTNINKFEPQASLPLDQFTYGPLIINSDEELELLNFTGTGESWNDPYVIKDLEIITNTSNIGIQLTNITKYVLITECIVYLTTPYILNSSYAIDIKHSSHIKIIDCNFFEQTFSYSHGVNIAYSQDIYIIGNSLSYFAQGISILSSENFTIEGNSINNIGREGIMIRYSENMVISNNKFEGRFKTGWRPEGTGLYISYTTNIVIRNNEFSFLDRAIDLIISSKIIISENLLEEGMIVSGISVWDVVDCEVNDNIIENSGISIGYSSGVSIIENTISRSRTAISFYSSNNSLIESNSILYPDYYAFSITNSSDIIIRLNILKGISLSIFSPFSTMKSMQFNYIIPSFSYVIFGFGLFSILVLCSIVYINFKRQSEKLLAFQTVSSKKSNNSEIEKNGNGVQINGDSLKLYRNSTKYLLDYEKLAFRKFSARIYLVLGVLIPLSLRIILFPRSMSGDFLQFINGKPLYNEFLVLYYISNIFLIIIWLIGVLFVFRGAKKVLPQKLFKISFKITKKETIIYTISIGIFLILWVLYYFLSMYYGFTIGLVIFGISCCICFIPLIYLPFKHKWVELPIIGVIFLIVSLLTYFYSTETVYNVLQGIKWAYWLLFIGSSIIVWVGASDKYENISSAQENNNIQ